MVIAGYSTGGVRFFHSGDGTLLGSVDTGSAVLAVKRGGQVMGAGLLQRGCGQGKRRAVDTRTP